MPLSKNALVGSTILAIVVGLLALFAIVGTTLWLVQRTQNFSDQLFAARQQRSAIVDLRSILQDAETGQRGYLLTRTEAYLGPYSDARTKVRDQMGKVIEATRGSTDQASRADSLALTIDSKLKELDETVALAKAGKVDQA